MYNKLIIIILLIILLIIVAINSFQQPLETHVLRPQTNAVEQQNRMPIQQKSNPAPDIMRDENDMPKSDVKVPEIG